MKKVIFFVLWGLANRLSDDYGNAVYVFNREFGEYFDIILPKTVILSGVNNSYKKANLNQEKN